MMALRIFTVAFVLFSFLMTEAKTLAPALKTIVVQDGGRTKPFDTFARESLQLIYGKQSFKKTDGEKLEASDVVFTWMLVPDHWDSVKMVQVRESHLREALGLDSKEIFYSPKELMFNERLALLVQELKTKRQNQEKLTPYYQAIQTLESQVSLYQAIKIGQVPGVWPDNESESKRWKSISELEGEAKTSFHEVSSAFVKTIVTSQNKDQAANINDYEKKLDEKVLEFRNKQKQQMGEFADKILSHAKMELQYNKYHPFMWSWIVYLLGTLLALFSKEWKGWIKTTSVGFFILGLIIHSVGFLIRSYITERPPVSNMYETVVWVSWGVVFFALILNKFQASRFLMVGAGFVATLCLVLSDLAPVVLDPTLQPLQPVLRDNFWLITHVMVITISYAAFFLALGIGNVNLVYYLKDESKHKKFLKSMNQLIYRCHQIGVVLLAAGIILGGVWADYSWGRFWGWDPKETWALIALLGYLAILHGRLTGWVKDFGLTTLSIVAFALVVMAWYGVNFVLGAGLHSYGFGAGGVEVVSAIIAVQLVFVVYVTIIRKNRLK